MADSVQPEEYVRGLLSGEKAGLVPSMIRLALVPPSLVYALGMRTRNLLFDTGIFVASPAPCAVVSVGNLVAGGTGKTPMVEWLARWFVERSVPVAILSRGYGAVESQGGAGDEALVLHENLPAVPHLQGPRRAPLARRAHDEFRARVVILDDGFQHRWIRRDLDLVLLDATHSRALYRVLPRGLLREPFRGLRRAHCAVITRSDLASPEHLEWIRDRIRRTRPDLPIVETRHRRTGVIRRKDESNVDPEELRGARVVLLSGIGNPGAFERMARSLPIEVAGIVRFSDHHPYTRAEIDAVEARADRLGARAILTTQKDVVKIGRMTGRRVPVWYLGIAVEIVRGEDRLVSLLDALKVT